jgi:DNA invertase Pin-like site-specific DNA recombinase
LIKERQLEGIALAKKKGVYRGRANVLSSEQAAELQRRHAAGEQKAQLARELRISRQTVYNYLETEQKPA